MRDPDPDGRQPGAAGRPASRPLVAVVGGGISGLAAAWSLSESGGVDVVVLEQRSRVGGVLRAGSVGGMQVDLGAESVLARRPEAVDLIRRAGLEADLVHPATATASVFSRGRLHPLPAGSVMGIPGDAATVRGLLDAEEAARLEREPSLPTSPVVEDVDVASWVASRVGPAVVDRLVEPLLGGVYAGHAHRLSLQATMPVIWDVARSGGSLLEGVRRQQAAAAPPSTSRGGAAAPVFAGIRGGVGRLPLALADGLAARGVRVRIGLAVTALHRSGSGWALEIRRASRPGASELVHADGVLMAVPPPAAARLLRPDVPLAAMEMAGIEMASVGLVAAVLPAGQLPGVPGSGFLVPPVEGRAVKAVTVSSAKWGWVHDQDPGAVAIRASLGRAGESEVLRRDDADLVSLALAEVGDIAGAALRPTAARVTRWGGGLPQYAVGHVDRVRRIREAVQATGGLAVCGAALDGVGIAACIATAERAAGEVLRGLRPVVPAAPGRMPS